MHSVARAAPALAIVAVMILGASPDPTGAGGFVFTVTRFDDPVPIAIPVCLENDCSLREAVRAANHQPGHDTILLPQGTYTLSQAGANEDAALTGDLDITDSVTISGSESGVTTIDASETDRVFHVLPGSGADLTLSRLQIVNGRSQGSGGGIAFGGSVLSINQSVLHGNFSFAHGGGLAIIDGVAMLENSLVFENNAQEQGGGIYNTAQLLLTSSSVSLNSGAEGGGVANRSTATISSSFINDNTSGGGILNDGGSLNVLSSTIGSNSGFSGGGIANLNDGNLTISQSSIINNQIFGDPGTSGGGVYNQGGPTSIVSITNATISGNHAPTNGGGFSNESPRPVDLTNVTISNNTAGIGGGVHNSGDSISIVNSIVSDNTASAGPDCYGPITSSGYDIIRDITGCMIDGVFNPFLLGLDPQLGPLDFYDGVVETHVLRSHSPAIDAANDASCPSHDGRNRPRPQDGDGDGVASCDIGAFELVPFCQAPRVSLPIPDQGAVSDTISINLEGTIVSLDLCLAIPHTWVGDLIVTLTHEDTGTSANLIDRPGSPPEPGCSGDDIFVLLSDTIGEAAESQCHSRIPAIVGFALAEELNAFQGEGIAGDWTLTVTDSASGDTGILDRWALVPELSGPTSSPTPAGGATATPTPTPPKGPTATPTPTPDGVTPTPTPTPTEPPAANALWGDDDCNLAVAATDALKKLQDIASIPYNVEPGCPTLGNSLNVQPAGFGDLAWGDTDCDGDVDTVDALQILRSIAALPTNQKPNCPGIGTAVVVTP